jgi:hypothetical protein
MATYGFTVDKETHDKYIKLTHLYEVSPYWFADQMRDKLNELINELWEKRKEKKENTIPPIIKDVIHKQENTQAAAPEEDLNILKPAMGLEDDDDE